MADSQTTVQATSMPYVNPNDVTTDNIPTTREIDLNEREDTDKEKSGFYNVNENKDNEETDDVHENEEKEENEEEAKRETKKPLLDDDAFTLDIKSDKEGHDTPTLPLPDKKKKSSDDDVEKQQIEKLPVYLFPFTRIKRAWGDSSNIFQFLGVSVCIIFQTVGWFTCVGGIPFLSLVMLIIGSIYVDDCKIEPNIPVYLIVSGVLGTVQHVLTIWTKYVPKESQGKLKVYRSYCHLINGVLHLFLTIWFILGCVWVYGAHGEVEFKDREKREYCHKTLYYFTFWMFNLSFILLGLLIFLSICFLICMVASDK